MKRGIVITPRAIYAAFQHGRYEVMMWAIEMEATTRGKCDFDLRTAARLARKAGYSWLADELCASAVERNTFVAWGFTRVTGEDAYFSTS